MMERNCFDRYIPNHLPKSLHCSRQWILRQNKLPQVPITGQVRGIDIIRSRDAGFHGDHHAPTIRRQKFLGTIFGLIVRRIGVIADRASVADTLTGRYEGMLQLQAASVVTQKSVHELVKCRHVDFCLVTLHVFQQCVVDQSVYR